jgi:hypothetical protein
MFHGSRGTYSAVLRNTHGDDTSFEALYAFFALQMPPHAVGPAAKIVLLVYEVVGCPADSMTAVGDPHIAAFAPTGAP